MLCDQQACKGHARQVERVLRRVDMEPLAAERVVSSDQMMALVFAGVALSATAAALIAASGEQGVIERALAVRSPMLVTDLRRLDGDPSETLGRFIEPIQAIESPDDYPRSLEDSER